MKAALPRLASLIPPSVKIDTIIDRTQTIRASVQDVEFTLALTIGLVVLVILLFLRDVRATLIPAVVVPLARRHHGGHVRRRVQPRQSLADGHDHRGRLRGRRRHRGGREHLPPHRGRRAPVPGRARRRARDRIHRGVDQRLAGRGVHPAAADGRHHRAPVPRVRHDGDRGHRGVGRRVADTDADARLALPASRHRPAWPHLSRHRAHVRRAR